MFGLTQRSLWLLLVVSPALIIGQQTKIKKHAPLVDPCDSVACHNAFIQNQNEPKPKKNITLPSKEVIEPDRTLTIPTSNHTCAIIKPDAIRAHNEGKIIDYILLNDFTIVRMMQKKLSKEEAETFYAIHKDKSFFKPLIEFMTSGPSIILELEHADAHIETVAAWRALMGATNPTQARLGSIRYMFGSDMQQNAVHGSDSTLNAQNELAFFFETEA